MKADEVQWEESDPPIDELQVELVERRLGVRLPDDFRRLLPRFHGGHPVPVDYIEGFGTGPDRMFSFDVRNPYCFILDMVDRLRGRGQLPDKIIPFARDGGGDMMCLDYREDENNPSVVYWAYDAGEPYTFQPLASSFTEFLEMLVEDPYAEMFAPSKTE